MCFWKPGWSPETCSPIAYFDSEGVYYARWSAPSSWWSKGAYDWSTDWHKARVFLKDGNNASILMANSSCGSYCYSGDLAAHIPVSYDIEIYFSAEGHTPNFPGHWNCPAAWGCSSSPPRFSAIAISPRSGYVKPGAQLQFSATALDQFGTALSPQPAFAWAVSDSQAISETGLFSARTHEGGPYTITAAAVDGAAIRDSDVRLPPGAWRLRARGVRAKSRVQQKNAYHALVKADNCSNAPHRFVHDRRETYFKWLA